MESVQVEIQRSSIISYFQSWCFSLRRSVEEPQILKHFDFLCSATPPNASFDFFTTLPLVFFPFHSTNAFFSFFFAITISPELSLRRLCRKASMYTIASAPAGTHKTRPCRAWKTQEQIKVGTHCCQGTVSQRVHPAQHRHTPSVGFLKS